MKKKILVFLGLLAITCIGLLYPFNEGEYLYACKKLPESEPEFLTMSQLGLEEKVGSFKYGEKICYEYQSTRYAAFLVTYVRKYNRDKRDVELIFEMHGKML